MLVHNRSGNTDHTRYSQRLLENETQYCIIFSLYYAVSRSGLVGEGSGAWKHGYLVSRLQIMSYTCLTDLNMINSLIGGAVFSCAYSILTPSAIVNVVLSS